jgi:hypothetical protein
VRNSGELTSWCFGVFWRKVRAPNKKNIKRRRWRAALARLLPAASRIQHGGFAGRCSKPLRTTHTQSQAMHCNLINKRCMRVV